MHVAPPLRCVLLCHRDPYALSAHYNSTWCYAFDPSTFTWDDADFKTPPQDEAIIYQLHVSQQGPEFACGRCCLPHGVPQRNTGWFA